MPEPHENETAFPKELLDKIVEAIGLSNPSKRSWLEYPPHCRVANTDVMTVRETAERLQIKAFPIC